MQNSDIRYVQVHKGIVVQDYLQEQARWLVGHIEQNFGWTEEEIIVVFRDRRIALLPGNNGSYPAVAIQCDSQCGIDDGKILIMHFLSSLSWCYDAGINIASWSQASTPSQKLIHLRMPSNIGQMTSRSFKPRYLPDPAPGSPARLALAFYREGMSLNHIGYSFLSFYRIINLLFRKEKKQKGWMRRYLPKLEKMEALKEIIDKIKEKHLKGSRWDVVDYLYYSCRCAVAHASTDEPTFDPENIEDENKFREIKPLIRHFAKIFIEEELKIKTFNTFFKERFYELHGFRDLISSEQYMELKQGGLIPRRSIKVPKRLSIRLWGHDKFEALENLNAQVLQARDGVVQLQLSDTNNLIGLKFYLNFSKEKLEFDPMKEGSILLKDDGSKKSALSIADVHRFCAEYTRNGLLEIWDSESQKILAWPGGYIGMNLPPNIINYHLDNEKQWKEKALERKE